MGGADERRQFPRFDVGLRLKTFDLDVDTEIAALTKDVSAKGIGCVSDHGLPLGTLLDIWLYLPDGEAMHTSGTIVWIGRESSQYRMGIELHRVELKPIPIVLRTLQMKTRHYS